MKTVILTIFGIMLMSVIGPLSKQAYENNWVFTTPPLLLALEAGQTAIFLQSRLNEASLYQAILLQLLYSFFKNTGNRIARFNSGLSSFAFCCAHSFRCPRRYAGS